MTNVIYNINIPDGPNNPSVDQPKMKTNTNSLKTLIEVDHIGFGNNHGGYHNVIHQETQTNVNTIAGVNQLFSGVPGTLIVNGNPTAFIPNNGDTQLYSLTGMGGLQQLTGSSANFVWCSGVLFQWGTFVPLFSLDTITFPIPFPTNILNIQMTLQFTTAVIPTGNSVIINNVISPTITQFSYASTATGAGVLINWFAIGN